VCNRVWKFFR